MIYPYPWRIAEMEGRESGSAKVSGRWRPTALVVRPAIRALSYHAVKPIYIIRRKTELYSIVGVLHTFEFTMCMYVVGAWYLYLDFFRSLFFSVVCFGFGQICCKIVRTELGRASRWNGVLCVSVLMCFGAERMYHEITFRKNGDCLTGNKSWMNNKGQQYRNRDGIESTVEKYSENSKRQ